jgi:hypothetical protein
MSVLLGMLAMIFGAGASKINSVNFCEKSLCCYDSYGKSVECNKSVQQSEEK